MPTIKAMMDRVLPPPLGGGTGVGGTAVGAGALVGATVGAAVGAGVAVGGGLVAVGAAVGGTAVGAGVAVAGALVAVGAGVGVGGVLVAVRFRIFAPPCSQLNVSFAGKPPTVKLTVFPAKEALSGGATSIR